MMLNEYQIQNNVNPAGKLEVYCKLEQMDPLYILSRAKEEKDRKKSGKDKRSAGHFFIKWIGHMKLSRLLNPKY